MSGSGAFMLRRLAIAISMVGISNGLTLPSRPAGSGAAGWNQWQIVGRGGTGKHRLTLIL